MITPAPIRKKIVDNGLAKAAQGNFFYVELNTKIYQYYLNLEFQNKMQGAIF